MGRWGDGEMGRWGDREDKGRSLSADSQRSELQRDNKKNKS
ncbi:hypothetical protein [Nostoc linckia]|nr:hypothetical protein [Nostoc linckia]